MFYSNDVQADYERIKAKGIRLYTILFQVDFAKSCNTAFAEMGVVIGGERLVATGDLSDATSTMFTAPEHLLTTIR